ncbi:DUF4913 domain-containing protein [Paenarthrobacter sp. NPDC092416]|uniref:DUF4913 domain-containing protein n=1 Tax=Paenarthrobacter sp. NPDC092416 TaxID=3364386 RepID=UPI00382ED24B
MLTSVAVRLALQLPTYAQIAGKTLVSVASEDWGPQWWKRAEAISRLEALWSTSDTSAWMAPPA